MVAKVTIVDSGFNGVLFGFIMCKAGLQVTYASPDPYVVSHAANHAINNLMLPRKEVMHYVVNKQFQATDNVQDAISLGNAVFITTPCYLDSSYSEAQLISLSKLVGQNMKRSSLLIYSARSAPGNVETLVVRNIHTYSDLDYRDIRIGFLSPYEHDRKRMFFGSNHNKSFKDVLNMLKNAFNDKEIIIVKSYNEAEIFTFLQDLKRVLNNFVDCHIYALASILNIDISKIDYHLSVSKPWVIYQDSESRSYRDMTVMKESNILGYSMVRLLERSRKELIQRIRHDLYARISMIRESSNYVNILVVYNDDSELQLIRTLLPKRRVRLKVERINDFLAKRDPLKKFDVIIIATYLHEAEKIAKQLITDQGFIINLFSYSGIIETG